MTYTAAKPPLPTPIEELRARIPGWGVDLDPKDRPSVPRERLDPDRNGAHWEFPERQVETFPRERSIEHAFLTPVFGTSCPLRGVSGVIRRYAYTKSEAKASHWLVLMAADRVDSLEGNLLSLLTLRPGPVLATGLRSELTHTPLASRLGRGRADVAHAPLDPLVVGVPLLLRAGVVYLVVRGLRRRR